MAEVDRSSKIAWTIVKVIFTLARFWVGALCLLGALGAVLNIAGLTQTGFDGHPLYRQFGFELPMAVWHAILLTALALLIWPWQFNPLFRLVGKLRRHQRSSRLPKTS